MQSGGGPLQPGPSVMRGLASGTSGSSQQQPDMQKMQSQPLMNQQYQQPNIFRSAGTNQATRQTRPMVPYHPHIFAPLFPVQYNRLPNQWPNYGSMPGMSYPPQYYMQPTHILPAQHQQNRRNATGENNLVNVNSNFSAAPTNGVTNLNPLTPIPQIQQVQLQQPQPNQQSSPMSHELLVMQQLHPPQPQQTPQQVTGGGQAPMDQHQPNPAQVNVGGPQPPHTMTSPIGVVPFIPPGPPSKVNKKKQRGSRAIPIINPDTQEDVLEKIFNDSTPPTVPTVTSVPSSTGQQSQQQQQSSIAVATAPTSTYNPLPPNVPPHVPLNPAVVEPEYENYSPHSHSAASDLGGLMHHQPPPHMHHPPPPPNHPPPHVHPGASHPGAPGAGGPGLLQHDMGRSPQPIVNSQQSHSELVYTGPIKIVNPPPHLPQQHHPSAVAATAEMTPGGTPVVSAIADGPSVEIKPYQKKKKPTNEGLILQQPPPPQHPMDAVKALSMSNQQQLHMQQQQQQQHMGLVEPIMYPPVERFRTVSEKSIAESTLSTDAEPFVYTRPSSSSNSSNNQQHRMPPPQACTLVAHEKQQSQQSSMVTPEMVVPAFVPTVVAPVPVVVPAEKQQQQPPQPPQETVSLKPEVEVEASKHLDPLVASVDKLSLEENNNNNSNSSSNSSSSNSAGLNQLPVGGAHGGKKNKQGKQQQQQQQQKRVEEVAILASETSNLVGVVSSSSKAAVTETVIEMKEQQQQQHHQSQQMAVEPVDETDRSAVLTDAPQQQQQSASSSLISNLVEHKPSKLDNDNIINNNIVDCTSTTIISTDNTTDNNKSSSPMENAIQHQQQQQTLDSRQHTPPTATATQLLDVENNFQQQQQQPEFDDNKNVVPAGVGGLLESISAPLSKQTTPEPAGQTTGGSDPQALKDTTAASGATTTATAAPVLPARKSRSLTLIEYDPDQWSPENPSGKKKYSRDQLLLLKNAAPAREKPINLPNSLEYVLVKTSHGGNPSMGGGGGGGGGPYGKNNFNNEMSLLPTFMKDRGGGGGGGGGAMGQMRQPYPAKRPSQQGNSNQSGMQSNKQSQQGMSKTGSKIIRVQLDEEVKLKECANAWRPRHLQANDNAEGQDRTTMELFKKFRSILNKLTPDNFDKLVQQVKSFVINTDEQLDGCIKLVFEKAVSEPNFSEAYAKMCTEIGTIAILGNDKRHSFKSRLVSQCQTEFERRRNDQTSAMTAARARLEASKDMSKEELEELKLQLEEEEQKVRRRAVGTVRFIGELFKHGQLTTKIMHGCITLLLYNNDYNEETLECLCKLLTTIGMKMEKESRQDLKQYFEKIENIVKNPSAYKISSRIRFMMQDVIDLRRIGWQPRRTDLNPKTMNQIQKEAETEQLQININYMARTKDSSGPYPGDMGRPGSKPMQGGSGGGGPKMGGSGPMGPPGGYNQGSLGRGGSQGSMKGGRLQTDDDGFRHISSTRNNRSLTIDPKKIAFPGSVDVTQARLGVPSMYQDWKNNSNIFAALNNEEGNHGGGGGGGGGGGAGSSMMDRDRDSDWDRSGSHRDRDRNQRDRDRNRDRSGSYNKNSGGKDSYHHNKGSMERERYNRYGSSNSQNDDRMSRSSREPSSGSNMRPMSGQHSNSQMHDRDRERERDRDREGMGGSKMPMQQQQQPPMGGRLSQQRLLPQGSSGSGLAMPSAASPSASAAGSMGPPPPGGANNNNNSSAMLSKSGSGQMYQQQQLPQFAIPKDAVRSFPEPDKDTQDKIEQLSKKLHMENNDIGLQKSMILFTELGREFYHAAISQLLFDNIERDSASREAVVKAIAMMFEEKHISKADYLHALEKLFQVAEDLIIDLPKLYWHIATFYVLLLHKRYIQLADILAVSQDVISVSGKRLLADMLLQYEHSYGQDATFMLWHESSLSFTDFIPMGNLEAVERYLTDSKLGYLLDSGSKALDMQTVAKQIKDSLASSPDNDEIFKWITKYIGPQRVTSKEFIRTLTRAVMEHCIDNETKLNPNQFQKWHPILQKYIDNKAERELQAMYAIQRLVVELEHPQNLLSTIVQQLYDCDVINDGFGLWKDSEDPLEAEGKGVCLKGIKQFVTLYMENSSDEDN